MPSCPNRLLLLFACLVLPAVAGCGEERLSLASPVKGKVLLDGKPLTFGGIMFQPANGPPARAQINSDGTFSLSTYDDFDGAAIGPHRVRVTCFENQRPATAADINKELPSGNSLIPAHYNSFDHSGLSAEVLATDNPELVFNLSSKTPPPK